MSNDTFKAGTGCFETAEFAEWLNLDGGLEALSPASQSPDPVFTSTSIESVSPSSTEQTPQFKVPVLRGLGATLSTGYKKRKASQNDSEGDGRTMETQGKKTSHNVIEKRYRSNLNDKIAALRESIPALRSVGQRVPAKDGSSDSEGPAMVDGSISRLKLNKATVLAKATEYIRQLEKQNERLVEENSGLRKRLRGSEWLDETIMAGSHEQKNFSDTSMTDLSLLQEPVNKEPEANTTSEPPVGMIPVPDEMRRLWVGASREHYAPSDEINAGTRGRFMSRLLLGSLTALMVMEGLSENETDRNADKPESRGLFALPHELLVESRGFREPIRRRIIAFAASMQGHQSITLSKLLLLAILLFAFLVYILEYTNKPPRKTALQRPSASPRPSSFAEHVRELNFMHDLDVLLQEIQQPEQKALGMSIRQFFARQIVRMFGRSWLEQNPKDEEAASLPSIRVEDFRRRWKVYADLLPKFFEESRIS